MLRTLKVIAIGAAALLLVALCASFIPGTNQAGQMLVNYVRANQGGTGTTTKFTAGSIPYCGSSTTGAYTQDNSNLYYDGTTNAAFLQLGSGTAGGAVRLLEGSGGGTNYTGWYASSTLAGNTMYKMPTADGSTGQFLKTDGSLATTWSSTLPAAPVITSATLAASPAQGTVQNDGVLQYFSPTTNVTGLTPTEYFSIVAAGDFSLQTASGVQSAFATTGDVWTLPASSTFRFEGQYQISRAGADNVTTAMAFACSNAPTSILYNAIAQNVAVNTTGATIGSVYIDTVSSTVVNATSTAACFIKFSGIIRTNLATTVTPQVNFSGTVTTPAMKANSYIRFTPLGTSTTNILGPVA